MGWLIQLLLALAGVEIPPFAWAALDKVCISDAPWPWRLSAILMLIGSSICEANANQAAGNPFQHGSFTATVLCSTCTSGFFCSSEVLLHAAGEVARCQRLSKADSDPPVVPWAMLTAFYSDLRSAQSRFNPIARRCAELKFAACRSCKSPGQVSAGIATCLSAAHFSSASKYGGCLAFFAKVPALSCQAQVPRVRAGRCLVIKAIQFRKAHRV